jgi:hypothetical protein
MLEPSRKGDQKAAMRLDRHVAAKHEAGQAAKNGGRPRIADLELSIVRMTRLFRPYVDVVDNRPMAAGMDMRCVVVAMPVDIGPGSGAVLELQRPGLTTQRQFAHLPHGVVDPFLQRNDFRFGPGEQRRLRLPSAGIAFVAAGAGSFTSQYRLPQTWVDRVRSGHATQHHGLRKCQRYIGSNGYFQAHEASLLSAASSSRRRAGPGILHE